MIFLNGSGDKIMCARFGRFIFPALLLLAAVLFMTAVSLPAAAVAEKSLTQQIIQVDVFPNLNFDQPTVIANAGDERLFIAEQPGRIWVVKGEGPGAARNLFLDISERVEDGCERGLLGLDFHPQYDQNGFFYLNYIAKIDGIDHTRVSRFQVSADPDSADPQSELILMQIEQPACNHNGGDLHFDPQGMLVTGLGDGGGSGDPLEVAQDGDSYLGKMLRINVDKQENGKNYAIPADNPFLDQAGTLQEIWTTGLRNPWRFSFDSQTGDLYIGDVGQGAWEEVNFVPANEAGGQNFEWSLKEGFSDFKPAQAVGPGVMTEPVHVYAHDDDAFCDSITGGFVYRGAQMGSLYGTYIYANFCGGRIYGLKRDQEGQWMNGPLLDSGSNITTFGEDYLGELYFAAYDTGTIYRLQMPGTHQHFLPVVRG
jgi:glucose/arabinose dehydrogenase